MFVSTADYNKICRGHLAGHLPKEIVSLLVGYVTTPGIDDLANGRAKGLIDVSIFGADIDQLYMWGYMMSTPRPTEVNRINIRLIREKPGEVRLFTSNTRCFSVLVSEYLDDQTPLTEVPTISFEVTNTELWEFICGDSSVVRPLISYVFKSPEYPDFVLGAICAEMRVRLARPRLK